MLTVRERPKAHTNMRQVFSNDKKNSKTKQKSSTNELDLHLHDDRSVDIELFEIHEIRPLISNPSSFHTFHQFYTLDEHHRLKLHLYLK